MMANGVGSRILPARDLVGVLREVPGRIRPTAQPVLAPGFPDLPDLRAGAGLGWGKGRGPVEGGGEGEGEGEAKPGTEGGFDQFREGCYALAFEPLRPDLVVWPRAVGTLRLENSELGRFVASGDLYRVDGVSAGPLGGGAGRAGEPEALDGVESGRIPIHPLGQYHGYLRIDAEGPLNLARLKGTARVAVGCSLHRIRSVEFNVWNPGEWTVWRLRPEPGKEEVLGGLRERATFEVLDEAGLPVGQVSLVWRSPFFREAVVEIDTEEGLKAPVDDGAGETWSTVFERVGWRVRVETGWLEGGRPVSGRWTYAELHEAMVRSRSVADLDVAWRYHVSVVRHFADNPAPLGIAFDHEASDRNGVPREGVAVNAGAALPADRRYGRYAGGVVHEHPDLHFRIAVHEVGHSMGLYHNRVGCGVMEQVDDRAAQAPTGELTPAELAPAFAADDIVRLRHLPDIYVRPGGTIWETQGLVEDHDEAFEPVAGLFRPVVRPEPGRDLALDLTVVDSRVPVGAPVRVDFEVGNRTGTTVPIPGKLGLATPHVRGWVTGPDGMDNEFRSLLKPVTADGLVPLVPGATHGGSLTLLRGHRGSLFARVGWHVVWIEIVWNHDGREWRVRERARVEVIGPGSAAEARAARRLVRTPETLGYLVLGRSRVFEAGEGAIDEALGTEGLRRHYAFIRARAVSTPHYGRRVDWRRVADLLGEDRSLEVLNRSEMAKARRLQEAAGTVAEAGVVV